MDNPSSNPPLMGKKMLKIKENRIILHFDYDCFYASVFEAENPALRRFPLAVQQKQIIVTCNYEARRRGLHKLQLITEAKRICPDVIIMLGENLDPFRRASKELFNLLAGFIWSNRCERLGFDEVWVDVTDMVDYNLELLNKNCLQNAFFQLDRQDPTKGFFYDASTISGHTYPDRVDDDSTYINSLTVSSGLTRLGTLQIRLAMASHLANFLRNNLEESKGYTATVGISVNKLLSKLVGNENKPNAQTTLLPPYNVEPNTMESNSDKFLDGHDVGTIPGVGYKTAQKIKEYFLGRKLVVLNSLVMGTSNERISVRDIRLHAEMSPGTMENVIGGVGAQRGIGARVWDLLHGVDESEVAEKRAIPRQISIEDSYLQLDTMEALVGELLKLSERLMERLRLDLTECLDDRNGKRLSWIAIPQTVRLSTRPRPPKNKNGSRPRSFNRMSKSERMPSFILMGQDVVTISTRLTNETLLPIFRRLHPEKHGWDLSLLNVAAMNMQETAGHYLNFSG